MTELKLVAGEPLEVPQCGRCGHVVSILVPFPSVLVVFGQEGGPRVAVDLDDLANVAPQDAGVCACRLEGGRPKLTDADLDALAEVLESLGAYRQAYGPVSTPLSDRWTSARADRPRHPSGETP